MQLHISRSQKSGLMGGVKFQLTAQVELTSDEHALAKMYGMSSTVLYEQGSQERIELRLTVANFIGGKTVECKDILEMMEAEIQIKDACKRFHNILMHAAKFQGEEVIDFV